MSLSALTKDKGMAMCTERIEKLNIHTDDKLICGTLHVPEDGKATHPLVIMSHGFNGAHMPQDPFAHDLASAGYLAYGFDFCGGGLASRSSGSLLDMSVLTEVADLNEVLDALMEREDVDRGRICLFGRSQGGAVSAYVAATRPQDVCALVMFFPAFVLQDDARARVDEHGEFPAVSTVGGRPIGRVYNEDAVSFDFYEMIGGYPGKVLIVHGDADEIVPLEYSQRALDCYDDAQLVVLPGQGHGFREGGNPEAARITLEFLANLPAFSGPTH